MAYTELGVVNLALQRLGAKKITSADWATPGTNQALAAAAAWEYIRDEVLEAADWNFAKTRTTLSKVPPRVDLNAGDGKHLIITADKWLEDTLDISIELISNSGDALYIAVDTDDSQNIIIKLANSTDTKNTAALIQASLRVVTTVNGVNIGAWTVTDNAEWEAAPATTDIELDEVQMAAAPLGRYAYAYLLPTGFLKIVTDKSTDRSVDPTGAVTTIFTDTGILATASNTLYAYALESLEDDTHILVTDYSATEDYPLGLVYIRRVTDVTKWTAHFVSTVAFRLGAELSFPLPESTEKFKLMMKLYEVWLRKATALNQSSDFVEDETGSEDWDRAGRT